MNPDQKLPESNYSVRFSDETGRVSVVDKVTEEPIESFSPVIDDAFIIQRMQEIREQEVFKQQFMDTGKQSMFGEQKEVVKGGIILPDGY